MQKWEYTNRVIGPGVDAGAILNEYGAAGWEAYSVQSGHGLAVYFFKRPLQAEPASTEEALTAWANGRTPEEQRQRAEGEAAIRDWAGQQLADMANGSALIDPAQLLQKLIAQRNNNTDGPSEFQLGFQAAINTICNGFGLWELYSEAYQDQPDTAAEGAGAISGSFGIGRASQEALQEQIDRLANFIARNVLGEPSQNQGAVDTAIRLLQGKIRDASMIRHLYDDYVEPLKDGHFSHFGPPPVPDLNIGDLVEKHILRPLCQIIEEQKVELGRRRSEAQDL